MTENKAQHNQNLQDTAKTMLKEKLMALKTSIKKEERPQTITKLYILGNYEKKSKLITKLVKGGNNTGQSEDK